MEGVVCLICCQTVNSSTSPSGRGRKRRKFSGDQEEEDHHYSGDEEERARSLLEEFYKEVGGGGGGHQKELATWTLCLTCVPFIDSAVVERRRCRELEGRVIQLQRELLEELRRLKEGMGRFYGELRQVEELEREGEQDYKALLKDGRLPNVKSLRVRIFEAVSELQVFQDDLNARLVVSPSPDMSCEDPVEAAVAMMKVEQVATDSDSSWGDLGDGSFDNDDKDIAVDVDDDVPEADLSAVEKGVTSVTQSMKTDPKPSSPAGLEERLRSQDPEPNIKVRPGSRKSKRKAKGRRVVDSDSETDTKNESDWEMNSDHDGDSSSDDDEEAPVRKKARTSKSKAGRESGTRSRQSRRIVRSDTSSDDEDQEEPPKDLSLKEQFISKALQVRSSKSAKQGHSMEYDSQAEKLTLGGVEVTFLEEGEGDDSKYVTCGSCPFSITWSEALSSIKGKFRGTLQIIKKMVSGITAHIHDSHLDTSTRPSLKQQFITKALLVKRVQSIQPKRPDIEYKRHLMEYDPQAESLTLGGIPLTFIEDVESKSSSHIQCGSCPYRVTWSEASSSIKGKYNGDPQILHKLVSSITTHIHASHLDAFKCHICGQSLASRKQFLKHMNHVHSARGAVSCDVCGMPLKHRSGLAYHKRTHMNEEEKAEAAKNGKNDPASAPDQDPGYRCGTCGKHFKYQKYLRNHEQSQHSDLKEYVICPICGKTVKKRSYITYHKRFSCPLTEGGRDHLQIQCLHCPQILKNPRLLRVHMNRFHSTDGEKRAYLCSICGKGFRAQGDVQMHMKTHEKERIWECRWGCGRDFNVERNCKRHETTCRNTKFDGEDSHS